ncbi:MAG: hypothetical protein KKA07_17620 [Bacteroidetes bacterium]|nr:hypothetical protein [Bacteroidota bacterium]MBU1720890.1 hypothetical protein [Bacteroidota bacterium]
MAGNEKEVVQFLFDNMNRISLGHLGLVSSIGAPSSNDGYNNISSSKDLLLVSTEDSGKKADIYINGNGVSLKQSGASFPFNRLQRANLVNVFNNIGFSNPEKKLERIDREVDNFHHGKIANRSRPWRNLFSEEDFYGLVKFLMTEGSPNLGHSTHPAHYILEAPKTILSENNIQVYSFQEYFEKYKENFFFSIRRQWIGQSSDSEHRRAIGLAKKSENQKWVYKTIGGQPNISKKTGKRWRDDVDEKDRRTVYLIFVEKT